MAMAVQRYYDCTDLAQNLSRHQVFTAMNLSDHRNIYFFFCTDVEQYVVYEYTT